MTDNNFSFELKEDGIYINNGGQRFRVSCEEKELNWDDARAWAQECGGDLGTVEQLRVISKHRDEVNKALKEAGKEEFGGWCWSNEEHHRSTGNAYVVYMDYGYVHNCNKDSNDYVRAVSALE